MAAAGPDAPKAGARGRGPAPAFSQNELVAVFSC